MSAVIPLDWGRLASYAATPFPPGWNPDEYVLFSPRDAGVHQAIIDVIASAGHSVVANHYGFDDDEISTLLLEKSADPDIAFILNLDKSQAGGVHEKKLLEAWQSHVGSSVAVGQSIKHAISHLKVTVVDGLYIVSGSTNLSLSGEQKQDNELRVTRDPLMAARYSAVILLNHAAMLAAT
ncbi:MAG TPA: phospholipase D-like domain-containing protein [Acidimicrobiales bacterium]|nr:phospholipase D-like domain-containing protein [Acidimicrobiales bacterium]